MRDDISFPYRESILRVTSNWHQIDGGPLLMDPERSTKCVRVSHMYRYIICGLLVHPRQLILRPDKRSSSLTCRIPSTIKRIRN